MYSCMHWHSGTAAKAVFEYLCHFPTAKVKRSNTLGLKQIMNSTFAWILLAIISTFQRFMHYCAVVGVLHRRGADVKIKKKLANKFWVTLQVHFQCLFCCIWGTVFLCSCACTYFWINSTTTLLYFLLCCARNSSLHLASNWIISHMWLASSAVD